MPEKRNVALSVEPKGRRATHQYAISGAEGCQRGVGERNLSRISNCVSSQVLDGRRWSASILPASVRPELVEGRWPFQLPTNSRQLRGGAGTSLFGAVQCGRDGIRVYSVDPGSVPMRSQGRVEEVRYGVLFLVLDESSYITGAELVIERALTAM